MMVMVAVMIMMMMMTTTTTMMVMMTNLINASIFFHSTKMVACGYSPGVRCYLNFASSHF